MRLLSSSTRAPARPGRASCVRVMARAPARMFSPVNVGRSTPSAATATELPTATRMMTPGTTSSGAAASAAAATGAGGGGAVVVHGVHHVALICRSLEASLAFYQGVLGLELNPDRPHDKLPYRGAWLWIGPEMIHLMELPNPDPADASARPPHGGRDRHFCVAVASLEPLVAKLEAAGVPYTRSASGRPAVFFRDPDANVIECVEGLEPWR